MNRPLVKSFLLMALLPALVSCSGGLTPVLPTPSPVFTATFTPTQTVTPTATITLTPSPAPTATVTFTPTPHPAQIFAEPILAFIADRSPDYQDDFSNQRSGWTINPEIADELCCHGSARYLAGEYAVIADPLKPSQKSKYDFNYAWGTNEKIIPALSNYVLQIEQYWASGTGYDALFLCHKEDCFEVRLWSAPRLDFWGESVFPERPEQQYVSNLKIPQIKSVNQPTSIMLIKKGLEIAIYINNLPVCYLSIPEKYDRKMNSIQLRLANDSAQNPAEVRWDNLKIWVLNP
jgi:hypothetical protein